MLIQVEWLQPELLLSNESLRPGYARKWFNQLAATHVEVVNTNGLNFHNHSQLLWKVAIH